MDGDPEPNAKLLGELLRARRRNASGAGVRLSREQAASRAEVSLTWYKRLEQGRAAGASLDVAARVAAALGLSPFERHLVLRLVSGVLPAPTIRAHVSTALVHLIEHADPYPAYVCNARRDILAYNRATSLVYGDLAAMARPERNVLRLLFRSGALRANLANWALSARRALATFRAARMSFGRVAWFDEVAAALHAESLEFRSWWDECLLEASGESVDHLDHPRVGRLVLRNTPLVVGTDPSVFVVLVSPEPRTDTKRRLARLSRAAAPGATSDL